MGERRGRKDGGDSRFEAEERRDRDWRCEHWMLIREGFNVEPVASSPPSPSSRFPRLESRCSYPSPFLFLLSPLLPSASSTRMCGYRFRLFPQEHSRCSSLRNAARKSSSCSNHPVGRGQDKENTELLRLRFQTAQFYVFLRFHFSSFSFLFWHIVVG